MRKSTSPDFKIHIDSSCLSNGTEEDMSPERVMSNQTVVHHDSWGEDEIKQTKPEQVIADTEKPEPTKEESNAEPEHDNTLRKESAAAREYQIDRIQAQIHAAARAVIASIEKENYEDGEDSVLSMQTDATGTTDEGYEEGTQLDLVNATKLSYDGTEATFESDNEHNSEPGADSSSHHDGDIDDDVFSSSNQSKRSSLNSCPEMGTLDENQKMLTSPVVGEEAASSHDEETISRIPSGTSYIEPTAESTPRTPSKIMTRPPFRTPSELRAMQMSSPTASLFSSPRSTKRHIPTVSRLGTPTSHTSPSKRTPTRFKVKKEYPLVLLHVTVMPMEWPYSHLMSAPEIPANLHTIKTSWRLLQEKIADTVLERGILLSHPQDSFETLEERLLEALELPVCPRAKILKCGHYMGPLDTPSSDEEASDYAWGQEKSNERRWCDICRREVRLEGVTDVGGGQKRFRIKVYASNGLMGAGAWAACWREMEKIDVEIEPFVEASFHPELEHLASTAVKQEVVEEREDIDDGFEDEESVIIEHVHDHIQDETVQCEEARLRDKHEEEVRLLAEHDKREEEARIREEEEITQMKANEEKLRHQMEVEEEQIRQSLMDEQPLREVYGDGPSEVQAPEIETRSSSRQSRQSTHSRQSTGTINDDNLQDLLIAAFKVAMRDNKNVIIVVLSVLVLLMAVRLGASVETKNPAVMMEVPSPSIVQITTTIIHQATVTHTVPVTSTVKVIVQQPSPAPEPVRITESRVPEVEAAPVPEVHSTAEHVVAASVPAPKVQTLIQEPVQEDSTSAVESQSTEAAHVPITLSAPLPPYEEESEVLPTDESAPLESAIVQSEEPYLSATTRAAAPIPESTPSESTATILPKESEDDVA